MPLSIFDNFQRIFRAKNFLRVSAHYSQMSSCITDNDADTIELYLYAIRMLLKKKKKNVTTQQTLNLLKFIKINLDLKQKQRNKNIVN